MIFVSGTKRSGTSMWMQVLHAAGVPILGKAFPRNWAKTLREANPEGFYESLLRNGIYFRTNPHPQTGKYFEPPHVEGYAVKVFIPGDLIAPVDHGVTQFLRQLGRLQSRPRQLQSRSELIEIGRHAAFATCNMKSHALSFHSA